jgi:hypothetical protein
MGPPTIKQYTITGGKWNGHRLKIQESGIPFLWVNSNNKYGPWKDPYMTIHQDAQNGAIVAAAKMGCSGWKRDFKVWQGNPDCTDLETWPMVKCFGKWSHEYRFSVPVNAEGSLPLRFAWRRTRDRGLGASKKWHRDFKLVALDAWRGTTRRDSAVETEEHLLDLDIDEKDCCSVEEVEDVEQMPTDGPLEKNERVLAVYIHDPKWGTNPRQARINFFEALSPEVEMFCLTVVMGLQEKISRSQDAFTCYSLGYGGCLRGLGNYV